MNVKPQRKTLRSRYRLPVSIGRKMAGLTADVSRGGFQCEVPKHFAVGSQIDGYFLLEDKEVAFHGTVAWFESASPQAETWSRMGVNFVEMPIGLKKLFSTLDARKKKLIAR